jgi:hypothetical protein
MEQTKEIVERAEETRMETEQSRKAAPRRRTPLLNDIRLLALRKWALAGRPTGDNARFWWEAEEELRRQA